MSLTIQTIKKKAGGETEVAVKPTIAKPAVQVQVTSETEKLADIIVDNYAAIEAAKEPKKLSDKARKELLELLSPAHDDKEAIVVEGTKGVVKFDPCSSTLECTDVKKVHEILGDEAFYALAKVGITDLKKYLSLSDLKNVTASAVGPRTMSVLPKQE